MVLFLLLGRIGLPVLFGAVDGIDQIEEAPMGQGVPSWCGLCDDLGLLSLGRHRAPARWRSVPGCRVPGLAETFPDRYLAVEPDAAGFAAVRIHPEPLEYLFLPESLWRQRSVAGGPPASRTNSGVLSAHGFTCSRVTESTYTLPRTRLSIC